MCAPEEDFRTFVAYMTEYIEDNPSFIEMSNDFLRILNYFCEHLKLPAPIEAYSDEFLTRTITTILQNLVEIELRDVQEFRIMIDILIRVAVALTDLVAQDLPDVMYPLDLLFLRQNPVYSCAQNVSASGYLMLCRHYQELNGLAPLRKRIDEGEKMPELYHFYLYFKIAHQLELNHCFGDDPGAMFERSWERLISYFKEFDQKNLRAADSRQLLVLASKICRMRIRSAGHSRACRAILDFAGLCLKCEFLEKQILGAKIIDAYVSSLFETDREVLADWLQEYDILGFILPRQFKDEVVLKLLEAMKTIIVLRKPTKENLDGLWHRVRSAGSSETPYSTLLTLCLKTSDEETELEFTDSVIKEGVMNASLLMFMQMLLCSTDFDSVIDKILEFLMSQLSDEKNKEAVLNVIKDAVYEQEVCGRVFQRCRQQLSEGKVDESTVEILTYILRPHSQGIADQELIDSICSCLEKSMCKRGLQWLLAVCLRSTKLTLTDDQFNKFWTSVDDFGFGALCEILKARQLDAVPEQLLHEKVDQYDYANAPPYFPMFLSWYVYAKGLSEGKIENFGYRQVSSIPEDFSVRSLDIEPLDFLIRTITQGTVPETLSEACHILISFLVAGDSSDSCQFLFDRFKDTLISPGRYEVKSYIARLIRQYIIRTETSVSAEDMHIKRHRPLVRPECMHVLLMFENEKEDVSIEPTAFVSTLALRAAMRFGLSPTSVTLQVDGRLLRTQYTLREYGIVTNTKIVVIATDKERTGGLSYPVPTSEFAELGLIDILETIAHDDGASSDKHVYSSVRRLLKVLPSDKKIMTSVTVAESAIKFICDASNPLEQKYVMECIDLGLKENRENNQVIAHKVLELLKQGKICDKSLSASFSIVVMARLPDISEYAEFLVPFICQKMSSVHSRLMQLNSVHLLYQVAKADPELTSRILLSPDSALNDVFLSFDAQTVSHLSHVFQVLPEKEPIFNFLQRFISDIEKTQLVETFFPVIIDTVTEKCEADAVVSGIIEKFSDRKGPYFMGICNLLYRIISKQPNVLDGHLDFMDVLVQRMRAEMDSHCQTGIISIISEILKHHPELEADVCKHLLDEFKIESNQWNFDPVFSERKSPYMGLVNYGITCYLNSVLQQIFADSALRLAVIQSESKGEWMTALQELFVRMQLSMAPFLATRAFCSEFKFNGMSIAENHEQQDASEFYQALIDRLGSELTSSYKGKMVNIIEGLEETYRTETLEEFCLMSVVVKGCKDLKSSLQAMIDDEQRFDSYKAESLGRNIPVKRYARIDTLPEHLVVHLKRFEYDLETWQRYKVVERFEFPEEFDFAPYTVNPSNGEQIYRLNGVVVHMGTAEFGHYYSIIKSGGKWLCFNDRSVTELSQQEFDYHVLGSAAHRNNPSAYMLFYSKTEQDYFIPKEKLLEMLPTKLKDEIDAENNLYVHNQAVFTKSMAKLVTQNLTSVQVQVLYLFNVLIHSKNDVDAVYLVNLLDKRMTTTEAESAALYISSHASVLIDMFRMCKSEYIIEAMSSYLDILVRKTPQSKNFIMAMVENMDMILHSWENISYFVSPISTFLKIFEIPKSIMAHIGERLLLFALSFFEPELMSVKVYQILPLGYVFECLCELFQDLDQGSLKRLFNYSPDILLSRNSMMGFTALLEKSYDAQLTTPGDIISILLSDLEHSGDAIHNMFFGMIYKATSEQALKKSLQFVIPSLPEYRSIILEGLYGMLAYDPYLRQKVTVFARILVFPQLLSLSCSLRLLAEAVCYRMFPTVQQLHYITPAEKFLPETAHELWDFRTENPTFTAEDRMSDRDYIVTFAEEVAHLVTRVAGDITGWCEEDATKMRLVPLIRVLRWLAVQTSKTELLLKSLVTLFQAICQSKWRGGGNVYECVRAIATIENEGYKVFENIDQFISLVFPIDFSQSLRLGWEIVMDTYIIAGDETSHMMMSEPYAKSLVNILDCGTQLNKIDALMAWITDACQTSTDFKEYMIPLLSKIVMDTRTSPDAQFGAFYIIVGTNLDLVDVGVVERGIELLMRRIDEQADDPSSQKKNHLDKTLMDLLSVKLTAYSQPLTIFRKFIPTIRRLIEMPTRQVSYGLTLIFAILEKYADVRQQLFESFLETPYPEFVPTSDQTHANSTIRALLVHLWCAHLMDDSTTKLQQVCTMASKLCPADDQCLEFLRVAVRMFLERDITDEHRTLVENWWSEFENANS